MNNKTKTPPWFDERSFMRAKEATDSRLPMIQNESAVSDYLLSEAACQSSMFNITEYNRQERQVDVEALFLTNFYDGDTAG